MGALETGIDATACQNVLPEHVKINEELLPIYACIYAIAQAGLWSYGGPLQSLSRSKALGRNPGRTHAMQGHPWGPTAEVTAKLN